MALLFFEGVEGLGAAGTNPPDDVVERRFVLSPGDSNEIIIQNGRYGGLSTRYEETNGLWYIYAGPDTGNVSTDTTKIWGFSLFAPDYINWGTNPNYFRWGTDTGSIGAGLKFYPNGTPVIVRSDQTTVAIGKQGTIRPNTWHDVQVKLTYGTTNGSAVVRVDNVEVLNATSINTAGSSGTYHRYLRLLSFTGTSSDAPAFDDIWVCDTTGNTCNDFLGNARVSAVFPIGDNVSEWTPSTGTTLYDLVDENPPNDATDYISDSTSTNVASFNTGNLPASANVIYGARATCDVTLNVAGSESFKQLVESGGTEYTGNSHALTTVNWVYKTHYWLEDPDTSSAWTVNGFNIAKVGVEVQ